MRVVDMSGKTVYSWDAVTVAQGSGEVTLPFAGVPGAVYLVEMRGEAGSSSMRMVRGR